VVNAVELFQFKGEKIVELRHYFDLMTILNQSAFRRWLTTERSRSARTKGTGTHGACPEPGCLSRVPVRVNVPGDCPRCLSRVTVTGNRPGVCPEGRAAVRAPSGTPAALPVLPCNKSFQSR